MTSKHNPSHSVTGSVKRFFKGRRVSHPVSPHVWPKGRIWRAAFVDFVVNLDPKALDTVWKITLQSFGHPGFIDAIKILLDLDSEDAEPRSQRIQEMLNRIVQRSNDFVQLFAYVEALSDYIPARILLTSNIIVGACVRCIADPNESKPHEVCTQLVRTLATRVSLPLRLDEFSFTEYGEPGVVLILAQLYEAGKLTNHSIVDFIPILSDPGNQYPSVVRYAALSALSVVEMEESIAIDVIKSIFDALDAKKLEASGGVFKAMLRLWSRHFAKVSQLFLENGWIENHSGSKEEWNEKTINENTLKYLLSDQSVLLDLRMEDIPSGFSRQLIFSCLIKHFKDFLEALIKQRPREVDKNALINCTKILLVCDADELVDLAKAKVLRLCLAEVRKPNALGFEMLNLMLPHPNIFEDVLQREDRVVTLIHDSDDEQLCCYALKCLLTTIAHLPAASRDAMSEKIDSFLNMTIEIAACDRRHAVRQRAIQLLHSLTTLHPYMVSSEFVLPVQALLYRGTDHGIVAIQLAGLLTQKSPGMFGPIFAEFITLAIHKLASGNTASCRVSLLQLREIVRLETDVTKRQLSRIAELALARLKIPSTFAVHAALLRLIASLLDSPWPTNLFDFESLLKVGLEAFDRVDVNVLSEAGSELLESLVQNVALPASLHLDPRLFKAIFSKHTIYIPPRLLGLVGAVDSTRVKRLRLMPLESHVGRKSRDPGDVYKPSADPTHDFFIISTRALLSRFSSLSISQLRIACVFLAQVVLSRGLFKRAFLSDLVSIEIINPLLECLDIYANRSSPGLPVLVTFLSILWMKYSSIFSLEQCDKIMYVIDSSIRLGEESRLQIRLISLIGDIFCDRKEIVTRPCASWVMPYLLERLAITENAELLWSAIGTMERLVAHSELPQEAVESIGLSMAEGGVVGERCLLFVARNVSKVTVQLFHSFIVDSILELVDKTNTPRLIRQAFDTIKLLLRAVQLPFSLLIERVIRHAKQLDYDVTSFESLLKIHTSQVLQMEELAQEGRYKLHRILIKVSSEMLVERLPKLLGVSKFEIELLPSQARPGTKNHYVSIRLSKRASQKFKEALASKDSDLTRVVLPDPPVSPIQSPTTSMFRAISTAKLDWSTWLVNVTVELLQTNPNALISGIFTSPFRSRLLHELCELIAHQVFPFAFSSCYSAFSDEQLREVMTQLSHITRICSPKIRYLLLRLSDMLESRERREMLHQERRTITRHCTVIRESINHKFNIRYVQDGPRIIVSHVGPGGPGDVAGVREGDVLRSFHGYEVSDHSQVRDILLKLTPLETRLELLSDEEVFSVTMGKKSFFNAADMAVAALQDHYYAKALHYYEMVVEDQFRSTSPDIVLLHNTAQRLCELYLTCGQHHQPPGILARVQRLVSERFDRPRPPFSSSENLAELPDDVALEASISMLLANGQHHRVVQSMQSSTAPLSSRTDEIKLLCASAAVALSEWDFLEDCVESLPDVFEKQYYECFLYVARNNPALAMTSINKVRSWIVQILPVQLTSGYTAAYEPLLHLQHLTHLEEVLSFRTASEKRRALLRGNWEHRMLQMAHAVQPWAVGIAINSLACKPHEDLNLRLRYASLCREANWPSMAYHTLAPLLAAYDSLPGLSLNAPPDLAIAHTKALHSSGETETARTQLESYARECALVNKPMGETWSRLYLLLGSWFWSVSSKTPESAWVALEYTKIATVACSTSTAAWHAFGMLSSRCAAKLGPTQSALLAQAVEALFQPVRVDEDQLGRQDLLRIMTIWFTYGHDFDVDEAVAAGIEQTPLTVWLRVIPQLMGRLGGGLSRRLTLLVRKLAEAFPSQLFFPLMVCKKTTTAVTRKHAAAEALKEIAARDELLHQQLSLISSELIRMAIFIDEQWIDRVYSASRLPKMVNRAAKLQAMFEPLWEKLMNARVERDRDLRDRYLAYIRTARSELKTALSLDRSIPDYEHHAEQHTQIAWVALCTIYNEILRRTRRDGNRPVPLASVSLLKEGLVRDVAPVPGTGVLPSGADIETISEFHNEVVIIPSKQKPRRIGILSNRGENYHYLLKGREDIRQDERVMQLFELINTIFNTDPTSAEMNLSVVRYPVIPLSANVGILRWIPNSVTLYKIIEQQRRNYAVSMNRECDVIESRGSLASINEYQGLSFSKRRELLAYVLDNTPSDELARIIWSQNVRAETWLAYRTEFNKSIATMSMVGYILGLGDRHLNNLLIQHDGTIAHVDFGDCFDVARTRSQFPEMVPFRLTRLMVRALGIVGVEGSFRWTCQHVLKQLRQNNDSLLTVLETFAYDPLVDWRLVEDENPEPLGRQETAKEDEHWQEFFARVRKETPGLDKQFETDTGDAQAAALESSDKIAMDIAELVVQNRLDDAMSCIRPLIEASLRELREPIDLDQLLEHIRLYNKDNYCNHERRRAIQIAREKLFGKDVLHLFPQPDSNIPSTTVQENVRRAAIPLPDVSLQNLLAPLSDDNVNVFQDDSIGHSVRHQSRFIKSLPISDVDNPFQESPSVENPKNPDTVREQVDKLINAATSVDNLACAYLVGWAPFL